MDQATRILFTVLRTGDVSSAKGFLDIDADVEEHEIVRLLLDRGANVNSMDSRGYYPLHCATTYAEHRCVESSSHVEIVRLLINRGAEVNMQKCGEITALHLAIANKYNRSAIVRLLLDCGARVDLQDRSGKSPLHCVAQFCRESTSNESAICASNISFRNERDSPSSVELTKWLMDKGADINCQDTRGGTPLHQAINTRNNDMVRFLLDCGARVDVQDCNGEYPIHHVCLGDETNSPSNVELIKWLMDKGADINWQNKDGQTPLHLAIQAGMSANIRFLLNSGARVDVQDISGESPFHYAVRFCIESSSGGIDLVTCLLDKGIDINMQNEYGGTALHIVLKDYRADNSVIIELLLKRGARVDLQDKYGDSPLHCVAEVSCDRDASSNLVALASRLIDMGANINMQNEDGETPLHVAITEGRIEIVRMLLDRGAGVDLENSKGQTPLHRAVIYCNVLSNDEATTWLRDGNPTFNSVNVQNKDGKSALHVPAITERQSTIITLLLDIGARVNVQDSHGNSPLHCVPALSCGEELASRLIEKGANINMQNKGEQTALHLAIQKGNSKIVRLLLDRGASVDVQDSGGHTPIHCVVKCCFSSINRLEVTAWLIDKGADINLQNKDGETALHMAIRLDRKAIVRLLLDNGAQVNVPDGKGESPLHVSVTKFELVYWKNESLFEVITWLIDKGADINMRNKDGETALHQAILQGRSKIVSLLLDRGASVDVQDSEGHTPIHCVVRCSCISVTQLEVIAWLVDKGVDINLQNKDGATALHMAIKRGSDAIIRLLLDIGAHVDVQDGKGQSPLHVCVTKFELDFRHESSNLFEFATWLIDKGANINLQNKDGKTSLHLAIQHERDSITILLVNSGAHVDVKDNQGWTSLHYIAEYCFNSSWIIKVIISRTVHIDVQDQTGSTPVHLSVQNHNTECLLLLLDWGGSMLVEDNCGKTPLSYLDLNRVTRLKNVLMQYIHRVKCAGLVRDVELLNIDVDDHSEYQTDLFQEIEDMKRIECGWSTVYHVFARYQDPLYVNNEELGNYIESPHLENEFLEYGQLLKSTFAKAKRRLDLLNRAVDSFHVPLPVEVKKMILSYIDSSDILCLVTCYTQAQV